MLCLKLSKLDLLRWAELKFTVEGVRKKAASVHLSVFLLCEECKSQHFKSQDSILIVIFWNNSEM